ncbi:hypothetical protein Dda_2553 [Drechslerella dactyloides]|uniref:Uncharacterized protein n=1 Tax=Drechslerella dactyloides TaxID=74499 RepID=A0AAD6J179_DREDA|nr:hypothetical protein Dda_2553 [Drechslerella dactyloides]
MVTAMKEASSLQCLPGRKSRGPDGGRDDGQVGQGRFGEVGCFSARSRARREGERGSGRRRRSWCCGRRSGREPEKRRRIEEEGREEEAEAERTADIRASRRKEGRDDEEGEEEEKKKKKKKMEEEEGSGRSVSGGVCGCGGGACGGGWIISEEVGASGRPFGAVVGFQSTRRRQPQRRQRQPAKQPDSSRTAGQQDSHQHR